MFSVPLATFGTTHPGNANDIILASQGNLNVSQTDYAANGGSNLGVVDGAFTHIGAGSLNRMRTLDSITDGPSNVVFIGEKLFNKQFKTTPNNGDVHGYASSISAANVRWCTDGGNPPVAIRPEPDIRDPNPDLGIVMPDGHRQRLFVVP